MRPKGFSFTLFLCFLFPSTSSSSTAAAAACFRVSTVFGVCVCMCMYLCVCVCESDSQMCWQHAIFIIDSRCRVSAQLFSIFRSSSRANAITVNQEEENPGMESKTLKPCSRVCVYICPSWIQLPSRLPDTLQRFPASSDILMA